jgi:ABC-type antimicrobial peptide transport system permease subunit
VGVAGDVKRFMFDRGMRPMVYLPHLQQPPRSMHFILRTRGEPEAVVSAVRAQMLTVDPAQPVYEVKSLEIIIDEQSSGVRVAAAFMAFYGLLALVLSAVGVYGVVANASQQRTHEIGIRMAIGARGNDILRLVLAQTARLAATGLGIGLLCSIAMGRAMSGLMFGMIALDASTIAIFTLLLSTVALLAGYIPAGRAARVDPMITLRHD